MKKTIVFFFILITMTLCLSGCFLFEQENLKGNVISYVIEQNNTTHDGVYTRMTYASYNGSNKEISAIFYNNSNSIIAITEKYDVEYRYDDGWKSARIKYSEKEPFELIRRKGEYSLDTFDLSDFDLSLEGEYRFIREFTVFDEENGDSQQNTWIDFEVVKAVDTQKHTLTIDKDDKKKIEITNLKQKYRAGEEVLVKYTGGMVDDASPNIFINEERLVNAKRTSEGEYVAMRFTMPKGKATVSIRYLDGWEHSSVNNLGMAQVGYYQGEDFLSKAENYDKLNYTEEDNSRMEHLPTFKIGSMEELEVFRAQYSDYFDFDSKIFNGVQYWEQTLNEYWDERDESFFDWAGLLITYVTTNNDKYMYRVDPEPEVKDDSICYYVNKSVKEKAEGIEGQLGWFIITRVNSYYYHKYTEIDVIVIE
ncbi:MAG: hypothetical protein J6A99_03810 [Clostridia bacterium]|nr:hypothetical protein [Clostridia bacterium]